jgi:hypothetical protein
MKKNLLLFCSLCLPILLSAQLFNQGGSITVESNAVLFVETDIINDTGTISNSGTIEVQGDLTNSATITSAVDSKVIFSGNADQTITSGGAVLELVELNKASTDLLLADEMSVNNKLTFLADDNQIILDINNLVISATGTIEDYDDNEYVVTGSTGQLVKQGATTFEYPVGFDQSTYNPVTLVEAGAADDKGVRVMENAHDDGTITGSILADEVVDASWIVTESVAGGSDLTVTPQWVTADELTDFDANANTVARYAAGAYDGLYNGLAASTGADPFTQSRAAFTEVGSFIVGSSAALDFVELSPRIFLSGPYNGTDMNDDLRTLGLIPTTEPYSATYTHEGLGGGEAVGSAADFDQTGTDDDIVDWVIVELRDAADNSTVVSSQSALLQRDGDIVGTDMNPIKMSGFGPSDYFVSVRHRNHLGVMSSATQSLDRVNTFQDFTDGSVSVFGFNAQEDMGASVFGLWAGNSSGNDNIKYTGTDNDFDVVRNAILGNGSNFLNLLGFSYNAYDIADVNLDGTVRFSGSNNDGDLIRNTILNYPGNFLNLLGFTINQQLP